MANPPDSHHVTCEVMNKNEYYIQYTIDEK